MIKGKKFQFPLYYVFEKDDLFSSSYLEKIIRTFCDYFSSKNYLCALGSNLNRIKYSFSIDLKEDYQIWVKYFSNNLPDMEDDWGIWKYSNTGKIDGIEGTVFFDKSNINYKKVVLENHFNGY